MNVGGNMVPRSYLDLFWYAIATTKTFIICRSYDEEHIHPTLTCLLFWILSLTYNMYVEITNVTVIVMIPYCVVLMVALCFADVDVVPYVMISVANFYPPLQFIWDLHMVVSTAVELASECLRTERVILVCTFLFAYSVGFLKDVGDVVTLEQKYTRYSCFAYTGVFLWAFIIVGLFLTKMNKVTVYAASFNLAVLMMYLL